jgi:hypothetical protein
MAWVTPKTWLPYEKVTDVMMNQEVRDRLMDLYPYLRKGDLAAALSATQIGRLSVGSNGTVLSASSSAAIGLAWIPATYVTNGDSHDHSGGDGAQIDHTNLANKGTNTHTQIDAHIANTTSLHVSGGNTHAHAAGDGGVIAHGSLSSAGTNTHAQIDTHLAGGGAHVPLGGIVMWTGTEASVPSGWHVCDGTSGTPDLRDRFVVGAGSTYDVGDTGGAATADLAHAHTGGTTGSSGSHSHSIGTSGAGSAHTHSLSATTGDSGAHAHTFNTESHVETPYSPISVQTDPYSSTLGSNPTHHHEIVAASDTQGTHNHAVTATLSSENAHTHTIPTTNANGSHTHTVTDTGSALSASQDIRPPYYAVFFIMRIS